MSPCMFYASPLPPKKKARDHSRAFSVSMSARYGVAMIQYMAGAPSIQVPKS